MKQTVLKKPLPAVRKSLNCKTALCIFAVALTLGFNLFLVFTASRSTATIFCILNIVSDVLCGVFLILFLDLKLLPERVLCRFAAMPMTEYSGTVKRRSAQSVRYMDMDCYEVQVDGRTLFLPACMELNQGERYRFRLVSNVIMEAEQ